jgi:alginate O-acetyltransferase complex protein AlgI
MIFTSFEFVLFFFIVLLFREQLRDVTVDKVFLLLASYCVYLTWSAWFILIIILISLTDYLLGKRLEDTKDPFQRKRFLGASLLVNLGLLVTFKYTNFILDNVFAGLRTLGLHPGTFHLNSGLPAGISYFTFASMSYVLDVYYERLPACRSALDYALFIAYFPKLLAGPIVRAVNFLPQLRQRARINVHDIETGLAYFLVGAVKKLVISDQIAGHIGLIFAAPTHYDGLTLLQGVLGYAVQIYCDFSGYSDMAIGCARMMGFRFPQNFQFPYSAASISEFWRRWHITLSEWFRDYIFLPLETATRSNRNATLRVSVNLMVTMLLCGLWHGAGWTFVMWGGIHGAALAVNAAWTRWNPLCDWLESHDAWRFLWNTFSRAVTLGVVLLGWIFFRADSIMNAVHYLSRMLAWSSDGTRLLSPYILPAVGGVVAAHVLMNGSLNWAEELPRRSVASRVVAYSCLLGLVVFLGATDAIPFIYFQF